MGYYGKIEKKQIAVKLRENGMSYTEIKSVVNVSKDTISRWCRDVYLTPDQKLRLINNKKFGQRIGSIIAAANKRKIKQQKIIQIYQESKVSLGELSKRDKFIAGIALYAAEGNKMDGKGGFANADPKLIKFMIEWFTQLARIDIERLRGAIWLHDNLDEVAAKQYWCSVTGLNASQFHKTYLVKSNNKKAYRKNLHKYGIFSIRFSDSDLHRKIMGWIYALFNAKITNIIFRDSSTVEQEAVLAALDRNIGMKNG